MSVDYAYNLSHSRSAESDFNNHQEKVAILNMIAASKLIAPKEHANLTLLGKNSGLVSILKGRLTDEKLPITTNVNGKRSRNQQTPRRVSQSPSGGIEPNTVSSYEEDSGDFSVSSSSNSPVDDSSSNGSVEGGAAVVRIVNVKSPSPSDDSQHRELTDHDVICARTKKASMHPGNRKFHDLLQKNRIRYQSTKVRTIKKEISLEIIKELYVCGGQFVKVLENKQTTDEKGEKIDWCQSVSDEYAYEKVSHALRSAKTLNVSIVEKMRSPKKKKCCTKRGATAESLQRQRAARTRPHRVTPETYSATRSVPLTNGRGPRNVERFDMHIKAMPNALQEIHQIPASLAGFINASNLNKVGSLQVETKVEQLPLELMESSSFRGTLLADMEALAEDRLLREILAKSPSRVSRVTIEDNFYPNAGASSAVAAEAASILFNHEQLLKQRLEVSPPRTTMLPNYAHDQQNGYAASNLMLSASANSAAASWAMIQNNAAVALLESRPEELLRNRMEISPPRATMLADLNPGSPMRVSRAMMYAADAAAFY